MNNLYKKGITIVEILVVLATIGIMVGVIIPQFSKTRESQVLKSAVADILASIDKARGQTLSSLNSSEYGVHFESSKIIIFKGKVFSSSAADNETIDITTPASITNVNLGGVSGSSGDMYFNRLYGVPSMTGTITLATDNFSKIITISATGIASVD